ncbi:terminase [Mycobacteroides abscessus]|uniref:terminase n=2 Tax=Mycobacteroides abscessus TaxID=36809 RepID=UPI0005E97895|nr:terminase [Mycobacteroides abscessus]MDM2238002.1 terminase [Mycobacteroides abscessus]MDM2247917.1 terminase [Mycobacteroides abscessus]MDM2257715.1 terminase [Mycobacteroides abscessus]MDM2267149.1 terminase [Mycobacteroides abscessus]MDM2548581.1 terminase [Mycobacteroides abscessus]
MTKSSTPQKSKPLPRLSEAARHVVIPEGIVTSVYPRVKRRLSEVGVEFDPWQQGFGSIMLGCRENGKYAATVGGVVASIPRQVGKTFTIGNIVIGLCLEFPGTRAVWTSHHNRTTTNTFRSFQAMVKRKAIAPHLEPGRSNGIREANGEQEIRFRNGSIIMFGARAQGFGRGMDEIDIEVFDEAQILSLKALEDMVPATNQARHPHGALIFFLGTPPRPTDDGEAFTSKRDKALKDKPEGDVVLTRGDQVYVEFSADSNAKPDDQSQWRKMNPSFPHRTPLESMLRMRENIPDDDSWAREAMGIWPSNGGGLITEDMWSALKDLKSEPLDPVSFGVYANKGQTAAAIAVAGYRSDGKIHVGIVPVATDTPDVNMLPGLEWIPPRVKELFIKWAPCAVMVDERSEAGAVIQDMKDLGVEVQTTNATGMANACSKFLSVVNENGLRHRGAKDLQKSVCAGKKRDLADAWAWDRKDATSDITQLVAVTLALHGLIVHGRVQETQVWGFYS